VNNGLIVIDPNEIVEEFETIKNMKHFGFLVNEELKARIINSIERKKNAIVVYTNEHLDCEIIESVKLFLLERKKHVTFAYIKKEDSEEKEYYHLFDEIIHFPKAKKGKLIECEPIKSPLFYWANGFKKPKFLKETKNPQS